MPNQYYVGNLVRLSAAITDLNGTAIDPTTITFQIRPPQGATTSVTPTHDGLGTFHYDQSVTQIGSWTWRVSSTGTAQTAGESVFGVIGSGFP